ncbi:DNA-packaging protein [Pelagibacterium halotolerans]|uniref:DNA-packaging protein n=1 Tax=Pelagibacterium halotolerans TaxID=531813 RepID=UPI00384B65AC
MTPEELRAFMYYWHIWARDEQLPPDGDWTTWLLIGGRGSGKTRAGAEWIRMLATGEEPVSPIALVGETMTEARAIMVEGVSGLLRVHPREDRPRFDAGRDRVVWPNGAKAFLLPANDPERFRGPQFAAAWCDETAKWPKAEAAWDMLQFGLRLGPHPRQLVTTTPKSTRLIKRLIADPGTVSARMKTDANKDNLAPHFLAAIVDRYRQTALGRQELEGEIIEEIEGALWSRADFDRRRTDAVPECERVIVAVDPPMTGSAKSDACGIVVAGRRGDMAFVLADRTASKLTPTGWARVAIKAFYEFAADAIIAEVNQGGDLVKAVLAQVDPLVPVVAVRANRGKWVRAEPVAALYAQGRVVHCGAFDALEDEMCAFGPDGLAEGHSPDRVDALVWAVGELLLRGSVPKVRF